MEQCQALGSALCYTEPCPSTTDSSLHSEALTLSGMLSNLSHREVGGDQKKSTGLNKTSSSQDL